MTDTKHIIEFGPKFCQAQFDFVLREDVAYKDAEGNPQKTSHWKRSFSEDVIDVAFDLTITEWINTEEIVFLFAWMYKLIKSGKKVTIKLPWYNATVPITEKLSKPQQEHYSKKYGCKFPKNDTEENIAYNKDKETKRRNLNTSLMSNWNLLRSDDLKNVEKEHEFTDGSYNRSFDYRHHNNTSKVIPFTIIQSKDDGEVLNFEDVFEEAITKKKLLEVEKEFVDILNQHGCYSIFESRVLTNVIFQELFFNTIQHAFDEGALKECFTGASFKQETLHTANADFKMEREQEMLDFFKNKEAVKQDVIAKAAAVKATGAIKDRQRNKVNLDGYDILNPMSYIKYTFLDFGKGYANTLESKYMEMKDSLKHLFSKGFEKSNKDSQIIEFAFLLETSRNPIDKNMEYYKFVPRGLFFLVDMVRRNKGLIKIRSGRGKVFYDFSDKVYGEVKDGVSKISIHNPYDISEAVVHSNEKDIPLFEGTMISILLPGKTEQKPSTKNKPVDARVLSPVRHPSKILENYVYYKNKDAEKKNNFSLEDLTNTTYEFISMVYVFHKAIKEFNEFSRQAPASSPTPFKNKTFYNFSFSALIKEIDKYAGKNCVIFFDFAELHYTSQVLKVIYYLLETPKINEVTKAVIINLDKVSDSIINHINTKITDESNGPKLFKAIPCLSFPDKNSDPVVKWIGLKDKEHGDVLTRVLIKKDLKDRDRRMENVKVPEDTEGNMFVEFDGRIYSFF